MAEYKCETCGEERERFVPVCQDRDQFKRELAKAVALIVDCKVRICDCDTGWDEDEHTLLMDRINELADKRKPAVDSGFELGPKVRADGGGVK